MQGAGGVPPAIAAPLEHIQIDPTVNDLIVALDVLTRCVVGKMVTLEAPPCRGCEQPGIQLSYRPHGPPFLHAGHRRARERFLIDFLPLSRRTLTRTGVVIGHIHYVGNALKPWIVR